MLNCLQYHGLRMHCTLLIPDLLLPRELGAGPYHGLRPAALGIVLARGTTTSLPSVSYEEWVSSALGVAKQQDIPVAAIMLGADGGDPQRHYWLCADPVYLRADRNRLVIAGRAADMDAAEASALIAALNQHFAGDGIEFCAPSPQRWYLRTERAPRLVTTPIARAVNRSIERNMPGGEDALAWHRFINEAQMILHAHPANAAREERDAPVVNSIWLWGGGTMPAPSRPQYAVVWSQDRLPRALAAAAGVTHHDLPANCAAWIAAATDEHHLLVLHGPTEALRGADIPAWRNELAALDTHWIGPLLGALREEKIAALTLVACNTDNLLEATIARSDLWRFWRRVQPLADYAGAA
jgi:hypothetical protein